MAKRRQDIGMTIEEFLVWDDGTDTRYELEHGFPVAMAPPFTPHGAIVMNAGMEIMRHLAGREPCRALQGVGVVVSRADQRFYVPDIVMTCEEPGPTPYVSDPRLIVEVLSPSTEKVDKLAKLRAYAALPSVEEIWLVASTRRLVLVWSRSEGTWIARLPATASESFPSPVLGGEVALDRLYQLSGV